MNRIVVGVDGSVPARAALRWAYDEAVVRRAQLILVTALEPMPATGRMSAVEWSRVLDGRIEASLLWQRDLLDEIAHETHSDLPIAAETKVIEGHPVQVLTTLAADADLVVVGDRGSSGLTKLVLGSVSTGLAHHAPCPVVIVRGAHVRWSIDTPPKATVDV